MRRFSEGLGESSLKKLDALSLEQLREGAVNLRPVYDRLAAIADLPLPEAEKAEKDLMSPGQLQDPARTISLAVLPSAVAVRRGEISRLARWAMFKAAMAVCEQGEVALSSELHQDPAAGGRFRYEKTPGGFRLHAKTVEPDGQPLTLEVGHSANK